MERVVRGWVGSFCLDVITPTVGQDKGGLERVGYRVGQDKLLYSEQDIRGWVRKWES